MDHEAEKTLERALRDNREDHILPWLEEFTADAAHPAFASDLLICLGRLPPPGTSLWRANIISAALRQEDLQIRDAAVQAAEMWQDKTLIETLAAHQEEELYLRDYIQGIIGDLKAKPPATDSPKEQPPQHPPSNPAD